MKRRDFLKTGALISLGTPLVGKFPEILAKKSKRDGEKMKLRFYPYTLELKHVFTVATASRKTTPVMMTEIEYNGVIGYGEASMPPYLGESHQTASEFLSKVDLSQFDDPFRIEEILNYVDSIAPGNPAAKASIDIALHDLVGKLIGQPWYKIWGLNPEKTPYTSFTIGIDKPDVVRQKVKEAEQYKILKVKLGLDNDKEMIETIRSVTDKPIRCDVNQGWKNKEEALKMIEWLANKNVEFVEQPMPKEWYDEHAWLRERSPLPIIADESVQRLPDVKKAYGAYDGINIKLMKSTGMREAYKMILLARALEMKVMLGCMTETSCAISAAAQLSPLVDWADLDGAELISNDLFDGAKIIDGKVTLTNLPGIGIKKI
ncbi:MAG: dipeptide epimerase [Ignavibacteria bacterium]|jgi:L-alanine-DL-glutamate epimerase-like enolase superfamily enzyme|nr:dipeptide epimerase [Ignavibacteria bacterium]MDH7528414.1 dipeptide epimerase [Ignavibacteria bacterium]